MSSVEPADSGSTLHQGVSWVNPSIPFDEALSNLVGSQDRVVVRDSLPEGPYELVEESWRQLHVARYGEEVLVHAASHWERAFWRYLTVAAQRPTTMTPQIKPPHKVGEEQIQCQAAAWGVWGKGAAKGSRTRHDLS